METDKNLTLLIFDFFKIDKVFLFIFLIVCIYVFTKALAAWSEKLQNQFSGKRLTILQITTVLTFISYLFGVFGSFYYVFRPSKELLVAFGGSAAVALGFALKDLVGSVVAGFILLFDRPFQVGDRVSFSGEYGEIQSIGLRSVRLVTLDDNLVTIPNAKFLSDVVSSGNSGALDMMVVTSFYINLKEDLEVVKEALYEVVVTSRFVYLEKPVNVTFEEVAVSNTFAIKANVKAYVLDVKYEKNFMTDITIRGNKLLNQNSILRPAQP